MNTLGERCFSFRDIAFTRSAAGCLFFAIPAVAAVISGSPALPAAVFFGVISMFCGLLAVRARVEVHTHGMRWGTIFGSRSIVWADLSSIHVPAGLFFYHLATVQLTSTNGRRQHIWCWNGLASEKVGGRRLQRFLDCQELAALDGHRVQVTVGRRHY